MRFFLHGIFLFWGFLWQSFDETTSGTVRPFFFISSCSGLQINEVSLSLFIFSSKKHVLSSQMEKNKNMKFVFKGEGNFQRCLQAGIWSSYLRRANKLCYSQDSRIMLALWTVWWFKLWNFSLFFLSHQHELPHHLFNFLKICYYCLCQVSHVSVSYPQLSSSCVFWPVKYIHWLKKRK